MPSPASDRLLADVAALADSTLWPSALAVDHAADLPSDHFAALNELGLHSMLVPAELGGLGLDPPSIRRVLRLLGGGCGATAFAFAQHGGVAAALAATENESLRARWLPSVSSGTLGGTAFAHVRRAGSAAVTATRVDGGWRLDGHAPWATSWGMAEVFTVAAVTDDGRLVWSLVPGVATDSLIPSPPMSLVAFEATVTVSLRFDGHRVEDEAVLSVADVERWRVGDRRGAVRPNPLCLGVGDRARRELATIEPEVAAAMDEWWSGVARRAEEAAVAVDDGSDEIEAIAAVRSETVFATQRMTTALMAAAGGRAADRGNPAQMLAREALFYVVQAQNADGRQATLSALGGGS